MARVSRGSFTTVNSTGSQRASDRFSTENTGSILAVLPIQGYSVRLLGRFRTFSEREEKTKIRAEIDSHGTRDSDASTSPGGGAAGVPLRTPHLHAVLRFAAAFGPRTPHILRRSCAVSLQKKALMTARSCYGADVVSRSGIRPAAGSAPDLHRIRNCRTGSGRLPHPIRQLSFNSGYGVRA